MIGNDACGSRSVRWGTTAQNVLALDVITADGQRLRLPHLRPGELAIRRRPGRLREPLRTFAARHEDAPPRRADALAAACVRLCARLAAAGARLRRRARPGGHRRHLCRGRRGDLAAVDAARVAKCLLVLGFADDIAAAAAVPALLAAQPVHGGEPDRGAAGPGRTSASDELPAGNGRRMAARRGRRRHPGRGARPRSAARGDRSAGRRATGCPAARTGALRRRPCGGSARTAPAMPRGSRTARPRGPASRTPRSRPTGWQRT